MSVDVAGEFVKALVGEADAEVVAGDLFELVGFVEDDGGGFGEDAGVLRCSAACCLMARSAKKRWWLTMTMSDSSALRRMVGDEAALPVGAGLAEAGLGAGVELVPESER